MQKYYNNKVLFYDIVKIQLKTCLHFNIKLNRIFTHYWVKDKHKCRKVEEVWVSLLRRV